MTARKSLRTAIDEKCRDCIFDPLAVGNWRQQVTLCSVYSCPLWEVRPLSRAAIPEAVLRYYSVKPGDPCLGGRNDSRLSRSSSEICEQVVPSQGGVKGTQENSEAMLEPDPEGAA